MNQSWDLNDHTAPIPLRVLATIPEANAREVKTWLAKAYGDLNGIGSGDGTGFLESYATKEKTHAGYTAYVPDLKSFKSPFRAGFTVSATVEYLKNVVYPLIGYAEKAVEAPKSPPPAAVGVDPPVTDPGDLQTDIEVYVDLKTRGEAVAPSDPPAAEKAGEAASPVVSETVAPPPVSWEPASLAKVSESEGLGRVQTVVESLCDQIADLRALFLHEREEQERVRKEERALHAELLRGLERQLQASLKRTSSRQMHELSSRLCTSLGFLAEMTSPGTSGVIEQAWTGSIDQDCQDEDCLEDEDHGDGFDAWDDDEDSQGSGQEGESRPEDDHQLEEPSTEAVHVPKIPDDVKRLGDLDSFGPSWGDIKAQIVQSRALRGEVAKVLKAAGSQCDGRKLASVLEAAEDYIASLN